MPDKSPFQIYHDAFDAMNADPTIQAARAAEREAEAALADLRAKHAEAERPLVEELELAGAAVDHWEGEYRAAMLDAQAAISEAVIAIGQSCTEFGVEAKYSAGRRSTSWKDVAEAMHAPASLIEQHTKPGQPAVSVRVI